MITSLLPYDHLAFSVLADERITSIGDTVRLYDLATGSVAVRSAEVLVVDEGRITVAVAEIDAPRLIAAISAAGVVAAITPSAAPSDWRSGTPQRKTGGTACPRQAPVLSSGRERQPMASAAKTTMPRSTR